MSGVFWDWGRSRSCEGCCMERIRVAPLNHGSIREFRSKSLHCCLNCVTRGNVKLRVLRKTSCLEACHDYSFMLQ